MVNPQRKQVRAAAEHKSIQKCLGELPMAEERVRGLIRRLSIIGLFPDKARVMDIGAAQGLYVIALMKLGYLAVGIEPNQDARETGSKVAAAVGVTPSLLCGTAECLPVESGTYDLVLANSVVEHVQDVHLMFREVYRVLRPGGVFWFYTTNNLCPKQGEISGFPCFSWYPDRVKLGIMNWVKIHKPHLVGHTKFPAVNWFTPWKARRFLRKAGFRKVYDRWDLRRGDNCGRMSRAALDFMHWCPFAKIFADICISDSSYAAVK